MNYYQIQTNTYTYILIHTDTVIYMNLQTDTFKYKRYIQLLFYTVNTFKYIQIHTYIWKYIQILFYTYNTFKYIHIHPNTCQYIHSYPIGAGIVALAKGPQDALVVLPRP